MAEEWNDTTQAMLTMTIALFMRQAGIDTIDITLDEQSIQKLVDEYTLDRVFYTSADSATPRMRVTMTSKEIPSEPFVNQEVTSDEKWRLP